MKIGFIGAGVIAKAHIGCMQRSVPEAEIVGVSDIDGQRAAQVADEFGITAFENNAALLEAGVDAVFVCTYPKAHKLCVIEALDAGKHVFCEKPLAPTYEEGREIARAVRRTDRKFMVGYLFHFSSAARRIKVLLDSGDLGDLALAWSVRCSYFLPPADTWLADPVGGGILDVCTHDIEFLSWLGGRPVSVTASGLTAHAALKCVDTTSVTMRFKKGIGSVLASWASPLTVVHVGVAGTRGTGTLVQDGARFRLTLKLHGQAETSEAGGDLAGVMVAEQQHFIDAIRNDRPVAVGLPEALLALQIHEAIQTSWTTGQPVPVESRSETAE